MGEERRLALHHRVADEDDALGGQDRPDRPACGTRVALQVDRGFAPVQGELVDKGNFGGRPAHASQPRNRLPVCARLLALGFEGVGAVAEGEGGFFVGDDRAVHGARAEGAVGVRIEVDEHAFGSVAHAHERGAPHAAVFGRGWRVDQYQPARLADDSQRDAEVFLFNIDVLADGFHSGSRRFDGLSYHHLFSIAMRDL